MHIDLLYCYRLLFVKELFLYIILFLLKVQFQLDGWKITENFQYFSKTNYILWAEAI